jgi:hypothetical protein
MPRRFNRVQHCEHKGAKNLKAHFGTLENFTILDVGLLYSFVYKPAIKLQHESSFSSSVGTFSMA